jgi:hypothetical protein
MNFCRLCQQQRELRKSHIIPETFYKPIYDKKHRAIPISKSSDTIGFIQNGFRQKLLCHECENKLSVWENILKINLVDFGKEKSRFLDIKRIGQDHIQVSGIRYKEFKLAVLSILWRMSITSHEYFYSYKLGPYEEKIRKILLFNDLVSEKEYPIIVQRYELDNEFYPETILLYPPQRWRQKFCINCFTIWGHLFIVIVNDKIAPQELLDFYLKQNGQLRIGIRDLANSISPNNVLGKVINDDEIRDKYAQLQE